MMKFNEMKYERPNLDEIKKEFDVVCEKFKNAESFEEAEEAFKEKERIYRHVDTLMNLANIRHDIDTRDAYYDSEANFWDEATPVLDEKIMAFKDAMLNSKFRKDFENKYGDLMFVNAEIALQTFAPEIVEDLQKENKLTTAYGKLIASAQVDFEGKQYTLSQMTPFKNDNDDARRLSAWKAEGKWYKDHQGQLDEIYDELVKVRTKIAKTLGNENYVSLGYKRMGRNCYDASDIAVFRKAVQEYLVPVVDKVMRNQAKRMGYSYPMSYSEATLEFRSGNAKPAGSAEDIVQAGKKFYEAQSEETKAFFHTMLDGELMDLLSTEGKSGGGYCTSLADYGVPFIFANFNGTQHDVEVVTHEAGHAFAAYMNRDRIPMDYVWPTMDGCEVHSMSMEFFAEKYAEDFFGEDARKYVYSHLAGALIFIPYGTMVDHYQHIVYEKPEMTPKERHACWKELMGIYQPWLRLDGDIPFYSEGEGWQRQSHIYEAPFYYIDYCLAQTVALEFWAMMQEDEDKAWDTYMVYTKMGGTKTFVDLLAAAKIKSPFEQETLQNVSAKAESFLENYDLTGIA
ncbi:MAG: M3 family oligoendopeptidase [Solobacterium sp.]|nr:M3 family oligoendopeptidase [Solobacterium sp.]